MSEHKLISPSRHRYPRCRPGWSVAHRPILWFLLLGFFGGSNPIWANEAAVPDALPDFPESLITDTPQEGFALAIKLSRLGVKAAQPNTEVLKQLRPVYSTNADSLIASSQVVALHFQTIAAANDHWRDSRQ